MTVVRFSDTFHLISNSVKQAISVIGYIISHLKTRAVDVLEQSSFVFLESFVLCDGLLSDLPHVMEKSLRGTLREVTREEMF